MAETATLGWTDYIVIACMLGVSVGIGIYYRLTGGRQKTTEVIDILILSSIGHSVEPGRDLTMSLYLVGDEYFSANRSMSIIPVGIALMVSFMSAITLLGVSAENYTFGTQFVTINLSYLIGTPIVCYGFLPVFYKLQATSAYEYLERRFGLKARLVASVVYWIQLLLYSGVVLYAPALALEATTGMSKTGSILIIGLVCAFYSSIGGIKAVLITDVFQAFLMFVSLFVVIGTAAHNVGGLGEIWRIAGEGHRLEFDNISIDPTARHTWWSLTIGGLCTFLSLYGVNQVQVQRMLTVKSLKAARLAIFLNWPILTVLSMATCFSGLAIYSRYRDCDPRLEKRITSTDMLMPLYVMDTMSHLPGLPGLFIAGIFSAGLSTISAALNSLAAVTLEDYIKPVYIKCTGKDFPNAKSIVIGKLLAFVFGILCIAVAFLAQLLGGVLQGSLTIFGVVGGPLLGLFTLGMLFESATERGAVTGVVTSLAFLLWIAFGMPRPKPHFLPVSTEGCVLQTAVNSTVKNVYAAAVNVTSKIVEEATSNSTMNIVKDTAAQLDDSSFFYLYRISYMWYAPIGFLMTTIIGLAVSNLGRLIFREKHQYLDPDLFFPCVGRHIQKRRQSANETTRNSSSNLTFKTKYQFEENGGEAEKVQVATTHI